MLVPGDGAKSLYPWQKTPLTKSVQGGGRRANAADHWRVRMNLFGFKKHQTKTSELKPALEFFMEVGKSLVNFPIHHCFPFLIPLYSGSELREKEQA